MSFGADVGEFSLAHVVAFQHAILYPVSGGDGIQGDRNFNASAISPRESAHAFHCRSAAGMKYGLAPWTTFMRGPRR